MTQKTSRKKKLNAIFRRLFLSPNKCFSFASLHIYDYFFLSIMEWAVASIPLFFSAGTAGVIVYRYAKRVSVSWAAFLFVAWAFLQGAGFIGLAIAFDRHTSFIAAVLGLLWLGVAVTLLLRFYYVSMGSSILVIAAYTFAASHALHSRFDENPENVKTYGLVAAFLDIVAAVWAIVTICFSFSLLLHTAANRARNRRQPQQSQQMSQSAATQGRDSAPNEFLQRTANIFMRHMRDGSATGKAIQARSPAARRAAGFRGDKAV